MLKDPKESDPAFVTLLEAAMAEAQLLVPPIIRGNLGECHILWRETKKILKAKHGIDWSTPVEMNPGVLFD